MKFLKLICFLALFTGPHLWASPSEVTWGQLGELDITPGSTKGLTDDFKKTLDGSVSVKGFMMPLDYSQRKITEFLLMPYVPACMHVPPPPANQLILVKMAEGHEVEPSFYPVEVTGRITINPSEEFESSYEMVGQSMSELK